MYKIHISTIVNNAMNYDLLLFICTSRIYSVLPLPQSFQGNLDGVAPFLIRVRPLADVHRSSGVKC